MRSIKTFLKRWTFLYHPLQKTYYSLRRFIETYILGSHLQEWLWSRKDDGRIYLESKDHVHRGYLIGRILNYRPMKSVLEVGCNTGPNIYLLAKEIPQAKIYGVDINQKAIKEGRKWLRSENLENVEMSVLKADNLSSFKEKSIDVILSDAVLIYVGPDKIKKAIDEMVRVGRKIIILNEWHMARVDMGHVDSLYHYGHWIHDYVLLFSKYVTQEKIKITKLTNRLWDDPQWQKYGCVIEVLLN